MKRVCISLAAALALAVPSFAQSAEETPFAEMVVTYKNAVESTARYTTPAELSAAIDATTSSKDLTITLLRDYTVEAPLVIKNSTIQDVTLDLAGYTLSAAVETDDGAGNVRYLNPIETNVRLVIKDSSETQTGTVRGRAIENTATLTIEGGTFIECDTGTGSQSGAAIYNTKKLIINGGVFKTEYAGSSADDGGPACVRNVGDTATLTITGGTFDSVSQRTYAIISSGKVEISPADGKTVTVSGPRALAIDSGTAVINGGTFTATGWYGLYVSNDGLGEDPMVAAVTINGGTFQGKEYAVWVGSDHNNPVNSTVYINDGVFVNALNRQEVTREDAIVAQGGTYAADPTTYGVVVAPGFKLESKADGKVAIVEGPAFAIGDKLYEKLSDAFAALVPAEGTTVAEGEVPTITLLRDAASAEQAEVPHGANGVFDLNGFTYTYIASVSDTSAINAHRGQASDPAITLTITDSSAAQTGTIVAQGKADRCIASTNSNLTITGGRFIQEGNSGYAIAGTDGLVIDPAEGRTVELPSGGLNLREGSWKAIKNEGVTIAGGTFIAGNEPAYALYTGNGNGPTTLSISGGTFEGGTNGHVAYFATTTNVVISGGDFTDGDLYINAPASTTVTVSGGDFRDDPRDYGATLPPYYSVVGKGNSVTAQPDADATYVAQIGEVKYTDLAVAFKALKNGDTIKLLADYVGTKRLEAKAFGVTVDLNGHTIDGGLYFHPLYSTEYCDNPNCAVIDTSGKPGTIKGKLPLEAGSGNSQNTFAVSVQEDIVLEVAKGGDASVSLKLGSGTRVLAEDRYIAWLGTANPLFKATDADNQAWIFPTFGAAVPFAADGVATLCADYSGNAELTLVGKTLTLDLGGHTYERIVSAGSSDNSIVDCTTSNTHLTIRNGTLKGNGYGVLYVPPSGKTISNLSLTMEDVTLASTFEATAGVGAGLMANGTMENVDFTLRRCKILLGAFAAEADGVQTQVVTDPNANICAIYFPPRGDSTLIIEDTIIKSPYGVQVCAGNLVVKGDTRITTTAANVASTKTGDGPIPDGAAISIVNRAGYGNVGTVTIEGTPTLIAQGKGATAVAAYTWNDNTQSDWAEASEHIAISGGTFSEKPDNAWFADGFIPVENEDGTFGVAEGSFAAEINGEKYLTLQAAFDAATATDTIKLLSSAIDTPRLTLTNGKTVSIDLNGHDIGFVQNGRFQVNGGKLTLTGEGRVYEQAPYFGPILIMGSTEDIADYSVVDVGKDVTLEGWAPLFIDYNKGYNCAYGVKVTMAGTANSVKDITGAGGHGVYINGSIKATEGNVPQITLTETSKVTSIGNGIYAAGYAHWTLAGDVSGADALSIKSGTFTITGGDYRGTGSFADPAEAHGNGSENTGAAISITTNPNYAQKTNVTITGGTFTSANGYAFYEGIAVKDGQPIAEASTAVISITNGTFTGSKTNEAITADIAITTAKDKQVVSGGTFNKMPDDALLTPGFVFVPQEDGTFGVIEGSYIASIGDVKYADFNSFFAAFKAIEGSEKPTTVTLLADLTGELAVPGVVPVKAGRNIVFDLNGHTMETALQQGSSTKHYYAIENSGTLTIKDSSAAQTGTIRARGVSNFAQGNLTVESGTLVAIDSDGGAALWNEGDAIVSGGKLLVEDLVGNLPAIRNEVKATLVVKGGEVQGQSRPAVINVGTMTIEGGLLWNTQCNVTSDGKHKSPWYYAVLVGGNANASLKMIGGTIRGTQGALTFIAGKGELTGGRCETVPCIYHDDTGGNIWHALYLSTTEGPVDVTVGGDFVAQSDGREAFVIGGNNGNTQNYTCKATVTGGTFIGDEESGFAALRVNNQRKDGVEPIIQGGHFEGGIESVADTGFEPITNFVSGGTFSKPVALAYCAPGYIPVFKDGKYTVDGTAVAAVANTETPGTYKGYGTLAALVKGVTTNGTEVLIVKPNNLGEEIELLKTATGGNHAVTGATAYDVAETLGGTFKVQDGAIVYAYQLGISKIAISRSDITVAVRLEEAGAPVTRTLAGRKVRVVSDGKTLAEADATFVDGVCELTFSNVADSVVLTIEVLSEAEVETPAE